MVQRVVRLDTKISQERSEISCASSRLGGRSVWKMPHPFQGSLQGALLDVVPGVRPGVRPVVWPGVVRCMMDKTRTAMMMAAAAVMVEAAAVAASVANVR